MQKVCASHVTKILEGRAEQVDVHIKRSKFMSKASDVIYNSIFTQLFSNNPEVIIIFYQLFNW